MDSVKKKRITVCEKKTVKTLIIKITRKKSFTRGLVIYQFMQQETKHRQDLEVFSTKKYHITKHKLYREFIHPS